jgi:hypothetical protein
MSNIDKIILSALRTTSTPLSAIDRNSLSRQLGISRNSSYILQRLGKIPSPIIPPLGPKFWYHFELNSLLIGMSSSDISLEELSLRLLHHRKKLPRLLSMLIPVDSVQCGFPSETFDGEA